MLITDNILIFTQAKAKSINLMIFNLYLTDIILNKYIFIPIA